MQLDKIKTRTKPKFFETKNPKKQEKIKSGYFLLSYNQ